MQADIDANPANVTARRDLAKIWLEKHRPRRALPLLEQAIARDPDSIELLYLSGVAHLLAGNHETAVPPWSRWSIASRTFSTARRTCARGTR